MHKTLNVRFLLVLLLLAGAVAGGGYAAHRFQTDRLAASYRSQADAAKADPQKAIEFLRRYLALRPDDAAAKVRLGMAMAELARRPDDVTEAYFVLQDALRSDPTLPPDVRRTAVKLALSPGQDLGSDARRDLDVLLQLAPDDSELLDLKSRCLVNAGEDAAAEQLLAKAITHGPGRVSLYARRATLLRLKLSRPDDADRVIEQLVAANPTSAYARVVAAEYWRQFGKVDRQAAEVAAARELAPDDPVVLFEAAEVAATKAEAAAKPEEAKPLLAEARALLIRGIEATTGKLPATDPRPWADTPDTPDLRAVAARMYPRLATILVREGNPAEAERWVRKGLEAFPRNSILGLQLADVLIRQLKFDLAEEELARLRDEGVKAGLIDFHRGRIAAAQGRWADATRALQAAALDLAGRPEVAREVQLLLAQCYKQVGGADRQYEAYKLAVPKDIFDPGYIPAQTGVAAALAEMGRTGEAIAAYKALLTRTPAAAIPLARLAAAEQLRRPADSRNWSEVELALAKAQPGPEAEMLKAAVASARGKPDEAETILATACAQYPTALEVWITRVNLAFGRKQYQRADELLEQASAKLGDKPAVRTTAARVAARGDRAALAEQVRKQAAAADGLAPADRATLRRALADLALEADDRKLARDLLDKSAAGGPPDLRLNHARFDLALLDGDEPGMLRLLTEIEKMAGGGEANPEGRAARAFYLIWKGQQGDRSSLAEADSLLKVVVREREAWPRAQTGLGRVADLRGDPVAAIRHFRKAIELGERSPEIIRRLLELYTEAKQYAEADALLKQMSDIGGLTAGAEGAISIFLSGVKNYEKAAEYARRAIPLDSKDARQLLWLGRLLVLAGKPADAVAPVRRATEVAADSADAWVSLVQLLAALKRPAEAVQALEQAKAKIKPADAPLAVAQCYLAVGKVDEAKAAYQAVRAARPDDPVVLRTVAAFLMRIGDTEGAAPLWEKLLNVRGRTEDEAAAKRMLALCLATSRDRATAQRGLLLLGITDPVTAGTPIGGESPDDLRVRALVLAAMPGRKTREAAVTLLEGLETKAPLSAEELFLLGRLYAILGDWHRARVRLTAAASAEESNQLYTAQLVMAQIRVGDAAGAARSADKLVAASPDSLKAVEFRARASMAEGDPAAAVKRLDEFAVKTGRGMEVAAVLEAIGLPERAAPLYEQAAAAAKTPAEKLVLPGFYARQGRLKEALDGYERVWGQVPAEAAVGGMVDALFKSPTPPPRAEIARVSKRVDEVAAKQPALRIHQSAVKSVAGDHDGSIEVCRQILATDPTNVVALNNLAYMLSVHQGKHDEGRRLIRRAVELAGPIPTFLDTEAVIELTAGNAAKAVDLLADVIADEPTAVAYFHQAQALSAAGRSADARAALAEAKRLNLKPTDLHPLEQPAFAKVMASGGR